VRRARVERGAPKRYTAPPSMKRFYVTTPIYYVTDAPHLGTAYTTIAADAFARYHQLRGKQTRFLTGTDEHGLKLEREATARGLSPKAFVDEMASRYVEAWPQLLCQPDDFIRTTEPRHESGVQELWKRCADAGDIYLGDFEGWYCVACEGYYTEKELLEGNVCAVHKRPVERMREASYFFRLSRYGDRLIDLYTRHPEMLQPETRRNEVMSFLREGLKDLSVSRTSFKWGIPVPGDPAHIMFVWFDALANYLTALGDGSLRADFWPPTLQLLGKDIIRFHCVYWPAFLMSAGFPDDQLPRTLFAHGFLTINGEKMGKSTRNTVEPRRLAEAFGPDEVRYYLLREIAFGQDGDFSHLALIQRIRAELGGTVGNLLHRTLGAFVQKYFDGKVPTRVPAAEDDLDSVLRSTAEAHVREAAASWDRFEPHRALEAAISLASAGNKYFDECAPWALAKDPTKHDRLGVVVHHVLELLRIVSVLLWPVLPSKMNELRHQLGLEPVTPVIDRDLWPFAWGGLAAGSAIRPGAPVFRNITKDDETRLLAEFAALAGAAPAATATKVPAKATKTSGDSLPPAGISYDEFAKTDLRLGVVRTAERIPKKDKLLRLTVDIGEASGPRTIIAGIALSFAPEDLVGRSVVVVANLAPRDFGKGLVSHGMLLACGPSESLALATVDKPQSPGTRVK